MGAAAPQPCVGSLVQRRVPHARQLPQALERADETAQEPALTCTRSMSMRCSDVTFRGQCWSPAQTYGVQPAGWLCTDGHAHVPQACLLQHSRVGLCSWQPLPCRVGPMNVKPKWRLSEVVLSTTGHASWSCSLGPDWRLQPCLGKLHVRSALPLRPTAPDGLEQRATHFCSRAVRSSHPVSSILQRCQTRLCQGLAVHALPPHADAKGPGAYR